MQHPVKFFVLVYHKTLTDNSSDDLSRWSWRATSDCNAFNSAHGIGGILIAQARQSKD
jgi:hypothetical protein